MVLLSAYCTTCTSTLRRIIYQWELINSVSLLFLSAHFFYKCLFSIESLHFGTISLPGTSHGAPQYGKISLNTFDSAAPRTYSIICISSESCLGSIVGFARLPCFGTLRSATSGKVALGELLRLCPGSSGRAPQ